MLDDVRTTFIVTGQHATKHDEIGASNAPFKKIHDAMMDYRADAYLWQQVSENTQDAFMMGQQRKKLL